MSVPAARAAKILDAQHAVATLAALTAPIRSRFLTANGTATAAGTELAASGGYTSGTSAPAMPWAAANTSTGSSATNAATTVTNMPGATVVGLDIFDSGGTPERVEYGALSASKTTVSGDTLSFATAAVTSALA